MTKPINKISTRYQLEVVRHIIDSPYETEYFDFIYQCGAYTLRFDKVYPNRLKILLGLEPNQVSLSQMQIMKEKFYCTEEYWSDNTIQVWFNKDKTIRFERNTKFDDITAIKVSDEAQRLIGTTKDLGQTRSMSLAAFDHLKAGIKGRTDFTINDPIKIL